MKQPQLEKLGKPLSRDFIIHLLCGGFVLRTLLPPSSSDSLATEPKLPVFHIALLCGLYRSTCRTRQDRGQNRSQIGGRVRGVYLDKLVLKRVDFMVPFESEERGESGGVFLFHFPYL